MQSQMRAAVARTALAVHQKTAEPLRLSTSMGVVTTVERQQN
ncbi:hypothetical protein LILAB_01065 [Corallococcus macrosporus]|uniref:Uncharacterized protein n=1 Tax=Myxococcus fulvus (strain ATCC BAA-855 / HW-1) TaxID=483219 RepID=F8CB40_MYXFH|nr:hypothetical protein LILAB_01065 [Corallococcus macrosporus]